MLENFTNWISEISAKMPEGMFDTILNFLTAIGILIGGWIISRIIKRSILRSRIGANPDGPPSTIRPVLASIAGYAIMIAALYAALTEIGVESASLLALLGGAALAIGLALQGTLSNIAAGMYLLMLRPLKVGEYVETPNFAGTVVEIGLFSSIIKMLDGTMLYVPNNQISSNRIHNFSRHSMRRLTIPVGVSYDTDLKKTRALLLEALSSHPDVITTPMAPEVFVMDFAESSVSLSLRCWMPADDWLNRASSMRIHIKETLDKAGVEIPFPQRVVTTQTIKS